MAEQAVKCPQCAAEGTTSRVYAQGGLVTLMAYTPFYDEQGHLHDHDSNRRTDGYHCSRGHRWSRVWYASCWCGWSGGDEEVAILRPLPGRGGMMGETHG